MSDIICKVCKQQNKTHTINSYGYEHATCTDCVRAYFRQYYLDNKEEIKELEAEIDEEIDQAVAFAEAGTLEPVENLTLHVIASQRSKRPTDPAEAGEMVETTYRDAVKAGIVYALTKDDHVFLMGEDVGR